MAPGDVRTIYDITPAYNAGYTGTGQTIAVVGQSAISLTDIEHFQSAAGLATKDPTLVLVPNSGTSTVYTDDESESDLDLEYSGAIAPGATIKFVYVGSSQSYSVEDAEEYAIDNNVAPIVSISYGLCEYSLGAADYASENAVFQQAAAQGQTVVAASGDDGSSDCASSNVTGLYVDFPASSQYVTGMGGTEFPSASVSTSNTTYWQSASGSDVLTSAKSYIPEVAWNDSTTSGLSSSGGGVSMYSARPSWQTGVTGIPAGNYRLVPDVSLASSPSYTGYLYCSSDTSTGITGSCSNGFRDTNNNYLTVAGGTSFAAPIFAGMVALINQSIGSTGQGLINSKLYTLASNSATYATAFHDITSGTNACTTGYRYCATSAASSFAAGTGYDEATGLGSVDFYNLLTAWGGSAAGTTTLAASTTTLAAATTTPASGASDVITITVASGSSSATGTPTGTISLLVDGTASATTLTLANGSATYTFSSTTAGTHTVSATYSGDATFAASSGTITLTVAGTSTASSSFTVAASNVSVTAGSSGASTVTLTPAGGYTGTVQWAIVAPSSLSNACYSIGNLKVSGSAAVQTTLTVYTSASACTNLTPLSQADGRHAFKAAGTAVARLPGDREGNTSGGVRFAVILVGLFGLLGLRTKKLRPLAVLVLLATTGLAVSGCGGSGSSATTTTSSTTTNAIKGTYSLTLTGTDTASSTLTASTNFTLVVD
jgi:subtilase family serine protease